MSGTMRTPENGSYQGDEEDSEALMVDFLHGYEDVPHRANEDEYLQSKPHLCHRSKGQHK